MPTLRNDPNLWPRFEALRQWAFLSIDPTRGGWTARFSPRDGSAPIACERRDLLVAVAAMIDEAEPRITRADPKPG